MTERERWIVYPLLFLALGASLRDKFSKPETLDATHLQCEELRAERVVAGGLVTTKGMVVVDPQGRPRVEIGSHPIDGGSPKSGPRLDSSGFVRLFGRNDTPVVQLGATADGGLLTAWHDDRHLSIVVGHLDSGSGLFAERTDLPRATPTPLRGTIDRRTVQMLPKTGVSHVPTPAEKREHGKSDTPNKLPASQTTAPAVVPTGPAPLPGQ